MSDMLGGEFFILFAMPMKKIRQAMFHCRGRSVWTPVSMLAVLLTPLAGFAADPVAADPFILKQLENEDYAQRQHATSQLLRDERLTVAAIERLYELSTGEEQRHRLLVVARHHMVRHIIQSEFDSDGHGFIGIGLASTTWLDDAHRTRPAIAVTATIPGFPGHVYLQPGDLIVDFEGLGVVGADGPIAVDMAFKGMITSKRAGQKVALTVLRDGRKLGVNVVLANATAVVYDKDTVGLQPDIQNRWQQRKKQLQETQPKVEPIAVDMGRVRVGLRAGA